MEDKLTDIAQNIYDRNSTADQFAVSTTAFHTHNGSDSPRVKFQNLQNVPISLYQQKGRSLIVNPTENALVFSGATLSLSAVDGFLAMPNCAGTPTGTPSSGAGSMVYDTTANKIWVWNGTAWKSIALV